MGFARHIAAWALVLYRLTAARCVALLPMRTILSGRTAPLSMSDVTLTGQALLVMARCLRQPNNAVSELSLVARAVAASWRASGQTVEERTVFGNVSPFMDVKRSTAPVGIERSVTFTGCGGLYTYLFGVAAYLQRNFDVSAPSTVFASASAGAFPAFLLAAGIDVEEFHLTSNRSHPSRCIPHHPTPPTPTHPILFDPNPSSHRPHPAPRSPRLTLNSPYPSTQGPPPVARQLLEAVAAAAASEDCGVFSRSSGDDSRVRPLGRWNDAVRAHFTRAIVEHLGEDAHSQVSQRHYISLTAVPSLANELVGEYHSVEDLVEGFIASAFVPIYSTTGELAASWRGRRFVDGGASDNAPVPFEGVPSVVLSPHRWRSHAAEGFPFVRADWNFCDLKFQQGMADAAAHHDELAAALPPKGDGRHRKSRVACSV